MSGVWKGSVGTIPERFTYTDGAETSRVWRITFANDRQFRASACQKTLKPFTPYDEPSSFRIEDSTGSAGLGPFWRGSGRNPQFFGRQA